jgi:hypothetical protein
MDMYMDFKLGRLTEAHIDELLEECRGLKGAWLKDPMAPEGENIHPWPGSATLLTFANQLRAELTDPRLEDIWRSVPKQEGSWGYGMVETESMTTTW